MKNKHDKPKEQPLYKLNEKIEEKFKSAYVEILKKVYSETSKKIVNFTHYK